MRFELWRQDDNANRFLVGSFPDRAAAEERLAELTRCPHKQTYWITDLPDGPEPGTGEEQVCALCRQPISPEERDHCLANPGRFNSLVFCREHQKRFSACAAMRWQPGRGGPLRQPWG